MARRVLLVDDNEDVLRFLRRMVPLAGVDVAHEAGSGEDAIAWMEENGVDVVIMDIEMPGMGGIEATRQIRERWPHVVVIGFTAYGGQAAGEIVEAGAKAVFEKTKLPQMLEALKGL